MSDIQFVYMTAGSVEAARVIGKVLVEERLAACVNMFEHMQSFYWWEGKVQEDQEVVLIAKTTKSLTDALIERVKQIHSYDCPCIVTLPVESGNPDFLAWIRNEAGSK